MNKANKITMSRIIMSIIIIVLLLFPFDQVGFEFPTYLLKERILIDTKYLIVGVLFIIASLTDFFDGYVARKYNMVTDFGKMMDAISDKLLTNSVLIILACNGKISTVVAVVIIVRDIVVDSIKMIVGNKGGAVAAINIAKVKTATLMCGIILTLFYNLPFELIPFGVADFLLALAAILSVISAVKYYIMAKPYLKDR
ncbi:MAG: CDP-diacylglycerol--glycerol-3-phosphate 3-phosphatidyltransferase [Bacilli bacterium]|nr:CDP-diacylglycerol--glycerol-3-phosphate 3-phosphatidyltransferase [Bacilli bacterium]